MDFKPSLERLEERALLTNSFFLDAGHNFYKITNGQAQLVTRNINSYRVTSGGAVFALTTDHRLIRSDTGGWPGSFSNVAAAITSFDVTPTGKVLALRDNSLLMVSDTGYSSTFSTAQWNVKKLDVTSTGTVYALRYDGVLTVSTQGYAGTYRTFDSAVADFAVDAADRVYGEDYWNDLLQYAPRKLVVQTNVKAIGISKNGAITYTALPATTPFTLRADVMSALRTNPASFDVAYKLYEGWIKRTLGPAFANIGTDGFVAAFATQVSYSAAPYGASPKQRSSALDLLHATTMNCADYTLLASLLYQGSALRSGAMQLYVIGLDHGTFGNHTQLYAVSNGVPLVLDPTAGVIARAKLDDLLGGVGTANVKVFTHFKRNDLQTFQNEVVAAFKTGAYAKSDLIYMIDADALQIYNTAPITVIGAHVDGTFYVVQDDIRSYKSVPDYFNTYWQVVANVTDYGFKQSKGAYTQMTLVDAQKHIWYIV